MNRSLVMSKGFADETANMDGTIKQKVLTFMGKFQRGVDGGLDLKQPKGARSPAVWTARVNDNYRAVLADVGQNMFALISVRTHDEAYDLAGHLRVEINPVTGGYDIIDSSALEKARALAAATVRVESAMAPQHEARDDARNGAATSGEPATATAPAGELPPVGVPEPETVHLEADDLVSVGLDPEIARSLSGEVERSRAEEVAENLPTAQGMALLDLMAGRAPEDVRADYAASDPVDVSDVRAALKRPVSQMTFVDMEDAQAVQAAMNGSLEAWRVWLHPAQRVLTDHGPWNGPFRVTGGAGTGKTVTAVHRAVHLAGQPGLERSGEARFAPVLFVTFTRNLATAIESQVSTVIRSGDTAPQARQEQDRIMRNIEVLNVDALARRIAVMDPGLAEKVTKGSALRGFEVEGLCATAVSGTRVAPGFLLEEWEQVVLANGITTRDGYLRVARAGRGQRLSRAQRVEVWRCIERLTSELSLSRRFTWEQLRDEVARALAADPSLVERLGVGHLVVDEAQDLTASHWRMLRALVPEGPDDMFLAGDSHQRIYGRPVPLSRFGIETRGRSRRLTVNYRTSRQILRWSLGVADGEADDLDVGVDPLTGERSVFDGPPVEVPGRDDLDPDPDRAVVAWIRGIVASGGELRDVAVLCRTVAGVKDMLDVLEAADIPGAEIKGDTSEDRAGDAVRIMTMHRAKGLEYTAVAIRDGGDLPTEEQAADDLSVRKTRNLYYVAATRARERLLVC